MTKILRNIFALSFICNLTVFFAIPTEAYNAGSGERMVYVCTKSATAYAYHTYKDCRHIERCWEENHIKKMSVSKAKSMKRTLCKTCAKRTSVHLN